MKVVDLADSQIQEFLEQNQQIQFFNDRIKEIKKCQNSIITTICRYENIVSFEKVDIDFEAKKMIFKLPDTE